MKKGNISLYIGIGITILLFSLLLGYHYQKSRKFIQDYNFLSIQQEKLRASSYAEACLQKAVQMAIKRYGFREKLVQDYLDDRMNDCLQEASEHAYIGFSSERPLVSLTISPNNIIALLQTPIIVRRSGQQAEVNQISVRLNKLKSKRLSNDQSGRLVRAERIISSDGNAQLVLQKGASVRDAAGHLLQEISLGIQEKRDTDDEVIGALVYNGTPEHAIFSPPATLIVSYRDYDLLPNIREESLEIGWLDPQTGRFQRLKTFVDTNLKKAYANISHYSVYALLAPKKVPFEITELPSFSCDAEPLDTFVIDPTIINTQYGQIQLEENRPYIMVVEGLVGYISNTPDADAYQLTNTIECSVCTGDFCDYCQKYGSLKLWPLGINGQYITLNKRNKESRYVFRIWGNGASLGINFTDSIYQDNTGHFTVSIYDPCCAGTLVQHHVADEDGRIKDNSLSYACCREQDSCVGGTWWQADPVYCCFPAGTKMTAYNREELCGIPIPAQAKEQVTDGWYCDEQTWKDPDIFSDVLEGDSICGKMGFSFAACGEDFCGPEYQNAGSRMECCGDDPHEYLIQGIDGTRACCDNPHDHVTNGQCRSIAYCGDGKLSDGELCDPAIPGYCEGCGISCEGSVQKICSDDCKSYTGNHCYGACDAWNGVCDDNYPGDSCAEDDPAKVCQRDCTCKQGCVHPLPEECATDTYASFCGGGDSYAFFHPDREECDDQMDNACLGISSDQEDSACCTQENACVSQGSCFGEDSIISILDEHQAICVSGAWHDPDESEASCSQSDAWHWVGGGETAGFGEYNTGTSLECCGDDPHEFYSESAFDASAACCDTSSDAVRDGRCISSDAPLVVDGCYELYQGYNDPLADRINIVFAGVGFDNPQNMLTIARKSIDLYDEDAGYPGLAQMDVYNEHMDAFNYWYLPQIADVGGTCQDNHDLCRECCTNMLTDNACSMPNRFIINLCNENCRPHAQLGGDSYVSVANDQLIPFYTLHEFQHQFPQLLDEYWKPGDDPGRPGQPNCAPSGIVARRWWGYLVDAGVTRDGLGAGYFPGCAHVHNPNRPYIRPTITSIMKERNEFRLGPVNARWIEANLSRFSGTRQGQREQMLFLTLKDSAGRFRVQSATVKTSQFYHDFTIDPTYLATLNLDGKSFQARFSDKAVWEVDDFSGDEPWGDTLIEELDTVTVKIPIGAYSVSGKEFYSPSHSPIDDVELIITSLQDRSSTLITKNELQQVMKT